MKITTTDIEKKTSKDLNRNISYIGRLCDDYGFF
jgi:hypothetical protein